MSRPDPKVSPRMPATQLANRCGGVSRAAISKAVQPDELRRDDQSARHRRLERLEPKLMTRERDAVS